MPRTLTEEQSEKLAMLLIMMKVPREECLDLITAIETPQELLAFLDRLSVRNYEMTPEEVHEAAIDALEETQT